jgi:MFS transporter, DHA2 family, methylenomycin A resistance protein
VVVRRAWTLAAATVGFGVIQLDVSVVNVAVKPIGDELGGGVASLQWIVSAYTVVFAALILSSGALGDRIGSKRVLVGAFAIFSLASLACGLAPNVPFLIAARCVQGLGAAALLPTSLSVLSHAYDDKGARARAVGIWAVGGSAALSGGPLVGGLLIQTLGWRWIFFINLPLAAFGIAIILWAAEETTRSTRRLDLSGQILGVLALGALTWSIIQAGQAGLTDPLALSGVVAAVALGIAFVVVERRVQEPMLPIDLFAEADFRWSVAIGFLISVIFYGLIFAFSLFFQRGQHASPLLTGLYFMPMTLAVMATNLFAARMKDRFGARACVVGSAVVSVVCAGSLIFAMDEHVSYLILLGPLIGLGAALGLTVPIITSTVLDAADAERSGVASGTLNSARQAGSALGVAAFGAFLGVSLVAGLRIDLAVAAALAVVWIIASLRITGRSEG